MYMYVHTCTCTCTYKHVIINIIRNIEEWLLINYDVCSIKFRVNLSQQSGLKIIDGPPPDYVSTTITIHNYSRTSMYTHVHVCHSKYAQWE